MHLMQGEQRAVHVGRIVDHIEHGSDELGVTPDEINDWFRTWRSELRKYFASRRVTAPDVDDLTQEVFFGLLRSPPRYRVENPRLFLFAAAKNVFVEWWAKGRRRAHLWQEKIDEPETVVEPSPERQVVHDELLSEIRAHIARLPERQRRLVSLQMDQELTYPQLALALGITERMVLRDLQKAHEALGASLRKARITT